MKVKGVDFVFYNVTDMKKAVRFYRDVLGLRPLSKPGKTWGEFKAGNMTLAIGVYGVKAKRPKGNVAIALAMDDVGGALAYLKRKKVKIVQDFYESSVCFMAMIEDPDGNQIILHRRKDGTVG